MSRTPLHQAVESGDTKECGALVAAGASVNAPVDEDGETASLKAAARGSEACVPQLVKAGDDVDEADEDEVAELTPLYLAVERNDEEYVALLLEAGANVNAHMPKEYEQESGDTALHVAVWNCYEACVSLLLKAGADVDAKNYCGDTPLHIAVEEDYKTLVVWLLKASADVNALNDEGWTPLHKAACFGRFVSLLLRAGANVNATNKRGDTPLGIAVEERNVASVALLAAADTRLQFHVPPELLRVSERDQFLARVADGAPWYSAVEREKNRLATIAVVQGESRWRRRRPLALIREQRRAVRDAGRVHKEWERKQQEEAAARKKQKRGSGGQ